MVQGRQAVPSVPAALHAPLGKGHMPWGEGAVLAPWIMNKNEEGGERWGDDFEGVAEKMSLGFTQYFPLSLRFGTGGHSPWQSTS